MIRRIALVMMTIVGCEAPPPRGAQSLLDRPERIEIGRIDMPALRLGTPEPHLARSEQIVVPPAGVIEPALTVPPGWFAAGRVVAEVAMVVNGVARQTQEPVREGSPPTVVLRFEPDEVGQTVTYGVNVRLIRNPAPLWLTAAPVTIPDGAYLAATVALPAKDCASLPVMEVGIDAFTAGHVVPLVRERLDPARDCDDWRRVRVPLHRLAGRGVRMRFRANPARHVDRARPTEAFVGDPRVLADPGDARPPNVILVSLDTLGARHMGIYGYGPRTTPALDAFARSGTTFDHAVAQYPSTAASHMTLMTGRWVAAHGVRGPGNVVAAETPLLAEWLGAAGFTTAAFTENATLSRSMGFARGFGDYRENRNLSWNTPGVAKETFGRALRWIRGHAHQPFFVFVHTYEVHTPYQPRPGYFPLVRPGKRAVAPTDIEAKYDAEARHLDRVAARFLRGLAAAGLAERTIVIFTADHGEAFSEHGEVAHGTMLYDEVMHVPLVIRGPGVPAGLRVAERVGLVDVAATISALVGVDAPANLHGRSLVPALRGEPPAARPMFAELRGALGPRADGSSQEHRAVWFGRHKAIVDRRTDRWQLFDVASDPRETRDLAATEPALVAEAQRLVAEYERFVPAPVAVSTLPPPALDAESREKLRALGYVE